MPDPTPQEPERTALTEAFGTAFADTDLGAYRIELGPPNARSSRPAVQHVRMRHRRASERVLVVGMVDALEGRAELRDYDHASAAHEVRFRGEPLAVERSAWDDFLRRAEGVLNGVGIQSMRTPPPAELLEHRRRMQRGSKRAAVVLAIVLVLAALVTWRVAVALLRA